MGFLSGVLSSVAGAVTGSLFGDDGGDAAAANAAAMAEKTKQDGINSAVQGPTPAATPNVETFGSSATKMLSKTLRDAVGGIAGSMGQRAADTAVSKLFGDKTKSAAEQGSDARSYLDNAYPELSPWEKAGSGGTSVGANIEGQDLQAKAMSLDWAKAQLASKTAKEVAGIQSGTAIQNTKEQVYAQNQLLEYNQRALAAGIGKTMADTDLSVQQRATEVARTILTQLQSRSEAARSINIEALTGKVYQDIRNSQYGKGFIGDNVGSLKATSDAFMEYLGQGSTGAYLEKALDGGRGAVKGFFSPDLKAAWAEDAKFLDSPIPFPSTPSKYRQDMRPSLQK